MILLAKLELKFFKNRNLIYNTLKKKEKANQHELTEIVSSAQHRQLATYGVIQPCIKPTESQVLHD